MKTLQSQIVQWNLVWREAISYRPVSIHVFSDLCPLGESSQSFLTAQFAHHGTDHRFVQHSFPLRPSSLYSFSQPPLVMFGQRGGQSEREKREWMKTRNIHQCGAASHSLNICFHFGVCFQLCAREYGAPKCGEGCFQVVIWHTPHLFFFFFFCSHPHFSWEAVFGHKLCFQPGGEMH